MINIIELLRLNQLKKQYLISSEEKVSFYDLIENHLGLHSTDYWTPYLSLFARLGDFDIKELWNSLNSGKRLMKKNAFRGTLFLISVNNYILIQSAIGKLSYNNLLKAPPIRNLEEKEINNCIEELINIFEDKPLSTNEIKQRFKHKELSLYLKIAAAKGLIVRASSKHAKSNRVNYSPISIWLPDLKIELIKEYEAQKMLINKYITIFGPVTENDISWWLPGTKTLIKSIISDLNEEGELKSFTNSKKNYYMNKIDYYQALSQKEGEFEDVISFLPYEDHFIKSFKEREWFISDKNYLKLFPRNAKNYWPPYDKNNPLTENGMLRLGEIRPSIWLNGKIIGRWEFEKDKLKKFGDFKVVYDLYEEVKNEIVEKIERKSIEIRNFINSKLVPISK